MIDLFKKHKKERAIKIYGIITFSIILALGINFIVFDSSIGKDLQISVINSQENSKVGDIYLDNYNQIINLMTSKDMNQVKSFSISVAYDPDSLSINNLKSVIGGNMIEEKNEDGFITMIINLTEALDIKKGDNIISFTATKNNEDKVDNINLVNANFTDSDNQVYLLSTSGLDY